MGLGRGGWGGQGGRGGYKVPPLTAVQIDAFAHISYQYFSDKNYKYLSAAEKAKLQQIHKQRSGNDNPSPPPPSIILVKRNISALESTLRDLERGLDPNDEHDLFPIDDDIEANASNSALTRQGRRNKGGK